MSMLQFKVLRAIIDMVGEETTVDLVLESVGTERLNGKQDAALDGQNVYGGYEGDETPDVPGGAQTGDNSMIGLWVVIAVLSAGMIFFPVFWKKRIS